MSLGALSITNAAIDGLYSAATVLELASMDDGMTKRNDCDHCGERDACDGTSCLFSSQNENEEAKRDG